MTATARKYNPGFLSDDQLVATFCVRTSEFTSIVETLRECSGSSNTHQIVIGPRGSGKTSLLLRVAAEIVGDAALASRFFPVVFAEESYEVSTAGEFWLECLSRLADRAPRRDDGPDLRRSFEELRNIREDRTLGDRCLGVLQDFADREGRRLVLFVENLNMMFADMADKDSGWRLRQALQTEPRIILLASATSRFDEMDNRDRALYDLFRVLTLRPLETGDSATLWRKVSGQSPAPQTIQALRILTGGSPRLLTIVARFGVQLSFRELMADLLDLVDDHTEYFKSHLDALPAQERRVYLALADLWKPATAREIADRARLDTSKCSAHLARLTGRGAVEVTGGTARRRLYYLAERLYNIYYLMRRARGPAPLIEALIRFMEGYYSADELKEFGTRIAREASDIDGNLLPHYRTAFEQLVWLPSLAASRDELLSLTPVAFASDAGARPTAARELCDKGVALTESGRWEEALTAWKELVRRFGGSEAADGRKGVSIALFFMGEVLRELNRSEEAIAVWDDAVRRCGENRLLVAKVLVNKGFLHIQENRPLEALAASDELLLRFRETRTGSLQDELAGALKVKLFALVKLDRPNETLAASDELLERFGDTKNLRLLDCIAGALNAKAGALASLGRPDEALAAWEEALAAWEEILQRYPDDEEIIPVVLHNKGLLLAMLNRTEESVAVWKETVQRFDTNDNLWAYRASADAALVGLAWHELRQGRARAAAEAVDRVLQHEKAPLGDEWRSHIVWRAHFVRAQAHLEEGDKAACALDIEAGLRILPDLDSLPKDALNALLDIAAAFGSAEMSELIRKSPASDLLLPLTTALERELGLEPRVAKEVEEVAEDIRRDMRERRIGIPPWRRPLRLFVTTEKCG